MPDNDTVIALSRRIVMESKVMNEMQPKIVLRCTNKPDDPAADATEIWIQKKHPSDEYKLTLVDADSRWQQYFVFQNDDEINKWQMEIIHAHLGRLCSRSWGAIFIDDQIVYHDRWQTWTEEIADLVRRALEIARRCKFELKK